MREGEPHKSDDNLVELSDYEERRQELAAARSQVDDRTVRERLSDKLSVSEDYWDKVLEPKSPKRLDKESIPIIRAERERLTDFLTVISLAVWTNSRERTKILDLLKRVGSQPVITDSDYPEQELPQVAAALLKLPIKKWWQIRGQVISEIRRLQSHEAPGEVETDEPNNEPS